MRLTRALSMLPFVFGSVAAQDFVARSLNVVATQQRGVAYSFDATWQNADPRVAAPAHSVGFYFSTDSTITSRDSLLLARSFGSLSPLATHRISTRAAVPSNAALGTRYLAIVVDHVAAVRESNETNNTSKRSISVTEGPGDRPDLTVESLTPSTVTPVPLRSFSVATVVRNSGNSTAPSSFSALYLSDDATITTSDLLLRTLTTPAIDAGRTASFQSSIRLSTRTQPGPRYLGALADITSLVVERSETNNSRAVPITVGARADMRADLLTLDRTSQVAGGTLGVTYRVSNQGNAQSPESDVDVLLDSSGVRGGSIVLARIRIPQLAPWTAHSENIRVRIPYYLAPSSRYRIWLFADSTYAVSELTEANNILSQPLPLTEYTGSQLQLEFSALRNTQAMGVGRTGVTMSASTGGSVGMVLKSKPLAGHWVLTSWGFRQSFDADSLTAFSLSLLNSPIFPLWFTRLDANGRAFPRFHLPKIAINPIFAIYGRTNAFKPDFSDSSGRAGFVTFTLWK